MIRREAIDAGRDRGKCDRGQAMGHGQVQRRAIAGCQQLLLTLAAAVPDRTDGVNDMLRRQPITAGDLGGAGRAAAKRSAFDKQFRSGGAMDRAVDATAAEQAPIGGIDDGVDRKRGDVGNADLYLRGADFGNERCGSIWHQKRVYHAHSAWASACKSTVLFTPISSKCSSRKRRAARMPLTCSMSKKS